MMRSKNKKDAIPGYILWISVFSLFVMTLLAAIASFSLADGYRFFIAGWEAGGIILFGVLFHTAMIVFVIVFHGGIFAFCGIGSFVSILKIAEDTPAKLAYGATALPFGMGVISGGVLLLLRKLLSLLRPPPSPRRRITFVIAAALCFLASFCVKINSPVVYLQICDLIDTK